MSKEHEEALARALDGLSLTQLEALYCSLLQAETIGIQFSVVLPAGTQEEE